jgi:predicted outer membrane repeat protein
MKLLILALSLAACSAPPRGQAGGAEDPTETTVEDPSTYEASGTESSGTTSTPTSTGGWVTYYEDADGDGFGAGPGIDLRTPVSGWVAVNGDCDDGTPAIYPGAADAFCDGIDSDCDPDSPPGIRVPSDHGSLQAAIDAAPTSEICVAPGLYTETLIIDSSVHLRSSGGSALTILDGGGSGRPLLFPESGVGYQPTLVGLAVVGGVSDEGGCAYVSEGADVTMRDIVVRHCESSGAGGAIYMGWGSALTLEGSEVMDNTAGADGGGIYCDDASLLVLDSQLHDNRAGEAGGGIYARCTAHLERVTMRGNHAEAGLAGWFTQAATLRNSHLYGHGEEGGSNAGTVAFSSGEILIENSIIAGNLGYGILGDDVSGDSRLTVLNSVLVDNSDDAIHVVTFAGHTDVELVNTIVSHNGGGVSLDTGITGTYRHCDVFDNAGRDWVDQAVDPGEADGNVSVQPGYRVFIAGFDPSIWDLSLNAESPLVDAGDPNLSDPDGSASDLGAYGGPLADNW